MSRLSVCSKRRGLFVGLAVLAVLAAGCSSDDSEDASGAGSSSSSIPVASDGGAEDVADETTTSANESSTTTSGLPAPQALHKPGPYDVGVTTIDLGDRKAEVWYPAEPADGAKPEVFDTLTVFPEQLQSLIPEELSGDVKTGAYRDAAPASGIDSGLPLVIYSHGSGGYRQVATNYTVALASWGYIVASTDHLERGIAAQALNTLGGPEGQDLTDVRNTIDAVAADPTVGPLVAADSVAITGHSAGAGTAARAASEDYIDAYVSISGRAPETVSQKPALVVIGELDDVVSPDRSRELFEQLESQATLIDIADGGHNSFTDSCRGIRDLGGLQSLVPLIGEDQVARAEDGCVEANVQPEAAQAALRYYTLALLDALFDNPLIEDGATQITEDVSGLISVKNLDADATGRVDVTLADVQTK